MNRKALAHRGKVNPLTRRGVLDRWMSMAIVLTLLLLTPALLRAQNPAQAELPRAAAEEVVAFFNADSTIRFSGRSGVPVGGAVVGNVATLGGPFTVGGRIEGDLLVLNGDLVFVDGGSVTGNVTVVGGGVSTRVPGDVGGTLTVHPGVLRVVDRNGSIELSARQLRSFDRAEGLGRTTFTVRAGTNYNRVEGLPVMFGPVFETAVPNSLRVEALGVWRSESGLTLGGEEFGYQLLVEQRFGRAGLFSLGGTLHSMVNPISPLGLSDVESSLGTFFLRKDYRDYYERTGWSAFVTAYASDLPLFFRFEFQDEEHSFAPVKAPWTLRRNDSAWRPQPLVAEGDVQSLSAEVVFDDRNDVTDPTDGWLVRTRLTHGVGGTLAIPAHGATVGGDVREVAASPLDPEFAEGVLDLRRYARVGPESDVALRLVMAGSLGNAPLPPQHQYALGGLPSLPGYGLFSQDCGARRDRVVIERVDDGIAFSEQAFPRYGCDRVALLQLEYRRRLSLDLDFGPWEDDRWSWYPQMDLSPAWGFFFDVGRGWSATARELDTDVMSDVGLALFLGKLGIYGVYPLRGENRDVSLFLRFQRRF